MTLVTILALLSSCKKEEMRYLCDGGGSVILIQVEGEEVMERQVESWSGRESTNYHGGTTARIAVEWKGDMNEDEEVWVSNIGYLLSKTPEKRRGLDISVFKFRGFLHKCISSEFIIDSLVLKDIPPPERPGQSWKKEARFIQCRLEIDAVQRTLEADTIRYHDTVHVKMDMCLTID
jgi:hypothetical protein